ncbi:hypothetical protein ABE61_20310 [Lysinibacillus sphaericus]|uniref:hypothetical protein n=1 Tax=Lysinibacillus sphaericus TaxID=1421 RepID=UPI0018CFD2F2|nr:hypothetical protein [Lysinibacillus sphaericus]MBG9456327.1 hypothetical protein [Lysinibacillus sphaericus]MBG9479310.1 hypothetical protein [Lysinibacillus sphaericus]MBG9594555.1 hypothetical protein [Lysinibacillus sphaericus]
MDDKQFEKRMELLKKSYDRMEPQLDPETVFAQIEAEDATQQSQETVTTQKPPSRWQKSAVWIACIASVLLVGVLVSSYVINPSIFVQTVEQEQEQAYDEWISNFTKEYKEKREQMRMELDIPEKEFSEISLVQTTDNEVDSLPKRKELFQDVQYRNDNFLNSLAKNILDNLQTPREQIQLIETYGNLMSFEESYYFYSNYSNSAEEFASYYSNKLAQYEKVLSQKPKSLPADLNKLIASAKKQYFELQYNGQSYIFRPNPVFGKDAPEYIERLHPNALGYFKYLATGSLLVGGDLLYSIEDSANILRLYEKTLLVDINPTENENFNVLQGEFENTWLAIFKGTETNPIRTKTGQFKPEYMDLLTTIANGGYGEAMRKTAQSILDEIKVTGQSKTLEQLTTYDIWMGILYLREDTFMQTDDGTTSMEINEGWIEQTKSLYDEYVKTKNNAIIETLNPFNIVSLFLYAHGVGDRDIAQRLLTDDLDINTVIQFDGMGNFKALHEMGGSSLSIRASVKGAAQGVIGQQLSFELTSIVTENGEQHYRISAINE